MTNELTHKHLPPTSSGAAFLITSPTDQGHQRGGEQKHGKAGVWEKGGKQDVKGIGV